MASSNTTRTISILLTFVAGFCDTVTFVAAEEVFSAHVTGNFIVLAYDLVNETDARAWLKLMTLPVFIAAVMTGRWITKHQPYKYALLKIEGTLLISSGTLAILGNSNESSLFTHRVTMLVVFGMGLQNAFGKLYSQETYGPTTVMTGNITQAALDVADLTATYNTDAGKRESFQKQLVIIAGFLGGCLLGTVAAKVTGLGAVLFPGLILLSLAFILAPFRSMK